MKVGTEKMNELGGIQFKFMIKFMIDIGGGRRIDAIHGGYNKELS
jgi:hypothetical protein